VYYVLIKGTWGLISTMILLVFNAKDRSGTDGSYFDSGPISANFRNGHDPWDPFVSPWSVSPHNPITEVDKKAEKLG
jgi:hypothetical protein